MVSIRLAKLKIIRVFTAEGTGGHERKTSSKRKIADDPFDPVNNTQHIEIHEEAQVQFREFEVCLQLNEGLSFLLSLSSHVPSCALCGEYFSFF